MKNSFRMDTFAIGSSDTMEERTKRRQTRATRGCRSPETLISDISDSACSQMQRRNDHDMIESPPAFLMNDQGPPSVIYDRGSFLPINQSMSFQTSYSAAMTEARTTKTSRTMFTTYSADVTETGSQDDVDCNASAHGNQENSVNLSVIHEHDENGFEIGYEDSSSCLSKFVGSKDDAEFCEVGRSHEETVSKENDDITAKELDAAPTDNDSARTPVLPSTNSLTSSNDKSGVTTITSSMLSTTLEESNKASNRSTSSSKRFFSKGFAKRFEKKTSQQETATADPTSLTHAGGSKDDSISLFADENTNEHGLGKFQDGSTEEDNTPNPKNSFENESLMSNDNMWETQQDMHEYGFEISDIKHSSTSASECTGILSVFAASGVQQANTMSTGHVARDSSEASSIMHGSSTHDNTLVEVLKSTALSNPSSKNRSMPRNDVQRDDNSTVESSLSHLTLSTEALTDTSFTSSSTYFRPSSEPKKFNSWLFAKMFACGQSSTSCEPGKNHKQCYSPIEEDVNSDEFSNESDEQETIQKQCHSLSLDDQDFDESLNIEVPLESARFGAAGNNKSRRTKVASRVIAKTNYYPGFEVTDDEGKLKVTTNSKSREINEIVSRLGIGQKSKRKEKKNAQPKKQSVVESLVSRRKPTRGMETGNSQKKNKKSILERIDIQVGQIT
ncbi:hypothetical protein ACHAW6_005458 [Cyclotella cf. meneghiniana]